MLRRDATRWSAEDTDITGRPLAIAPQRQFTYQDPSGCCVRRRIRQQEGYASADTGCVPRLTTVQSDDTVTLTRCAVIGAGLVGGSVALAAKRAGYDVTVYDSDEATTIAAHARGLHIATSAQEAAATAEVTFLAVPVDAVMSTAQQIRTSLPAGALVTDVSSVKSPVRGLPDLLRAHNVDVVLGHPMAGSQYSGFRYAREDLFDGCTWMLSDATTDSALRRLATVVRRLGAARVFDCDSVEHDAVVAVVSHLPQIAASALAATILESVHASGPEALRVTGGGFRDSTRIAESMFATWQPIMTANAAHLAVLVADLAERLAEISESLSSGNDLLLAELFEHANSCRRIWEAQQQHLEQ